LYSFSFSSLFLQLVGGQGLLFQIPGGKVEFKWVPFSDGGEVFSGSPHFSRDLWMYFHLCLVPRVSLSFLGGGGPLFFFPPLFFPSALAGRFELSLVVLGFFLWVNVDGLPSPL